MKSKNRKKLLCISAAVLILVAYTSKKKYHPNYKILNAENGPFATYSDGNVYIGNTDYLSSLKGLNPSDVLIRDERNLDDSNMAILNSYCITDKEKMNEILEIVCVYESMYPTDWDRSIESMRLEWFCHNTCYYLNYKVDRSSEVDLNNEDEKKYNSELIRRFLRI